jgi:hypothetical protein
MFASRVEFYFREEVAVEVLVALLIVSMSEEVSTDADKFKSAALACLHSTFDSLGICVFSKSNCGGIVLICEEDGGS